jgi:hypothetical protein
MPEALGLAVENLSSFSEVTSNGATGWVYSGFLA